MNHHGTWLRGVNSSILLACFDSLLIVSYSNIDKPRGTHTHMYTRMHTHTCTHACSVVKLVAIGVLWYM